MPRTTAPSASAKRRAVSREQHKEPQTRMSLKELFNDDGFDPAKLVLRLLSGSQSPFENAIARQALVAWIFLASSPTSESSAKTAISHAVLIRAALLLDRKCIRYPSVRTTRSIKMFQELHRDPDVKWLLQHIFLPLGGFGELVKCKAITSLTAEIRKRLKLFDTVRLLVSILHCAALSAKAQGTDSKRLSLAQAISTYLDKGFAPSNRSDASSMDGQHLSTDSSLRRC